jgi:UDP-N-acetylmuramyl tripeptide synthase
LILGEIEINLLGLHNVRNALAAVAIGLELEIPFDDIIRHCLISKEFTDVSDLVR